MLHAKRTSATTPKYVSLACLRNQFQLLSVTADNVDTAKFGKTQADSAEETNRCINVIRI